MIWVNCFDHGDMTQPFGGYKQSGQGRDKCVESLISYTQTKSAWINLGAEQRAGPGEQRVCPAEQRAGRNLSRLGKLPRRAGEAKLGDPLAQQVVELVHEHLEARQRARLVAARSRVRAARAGTATCPRC